MFIDESEDIKKLNEMIIRTSDSLDPEITNSIYYPRLKQLMFKEIIDFCKEKYELKEDLLELHDYIGQKLSEASIREYLDELKLKYNLSNSTGLDYHIESTRVDYGVVVFAIIKRNDILTKKFVFRFRKSPTDSLFGLSNNGVPVIEKTTNSRNLYYDNILSDII